MKTFYFLTSVFLIFSCTSADKKNPSHAYKDSLYNADSLPADKTRTEIKLETDSSLLISASTPHINKFPDTPGINNSNKKILKAAVPRLSISFISIGEGTDHEAQKMLQSILLDRKNKSGKEIRYEEISWGREGEKDFCFSLDELSDEQAKIFIAEIKKTFSGNTLVQITENQPCREQQVGIE